MKIKRLKPLLERSKRLNPVQADSDRNLFFRTWMDIQKLKNMEVAMKRAGESPASCFLTKKSKSI